MAKESQSVEKKSSSNKLLVIIIVFLLAVIGVGGFFAFKYISGQSTQEVQKELIEIHDDATIDIAGYDAHLILDEDDKIDMAELQRQADEGMMNLSFKNEITIENGKDGTCDIANEATNNYDMFLTLWLADTQEEIYRSGLIPLGSKIEKLELKTPLEVGEYAGILVYNQVEDNKIIGQVNVEVTLKVKS